VKKQAQLSTIIDNKLEKERHENLRIVKILLLGGADAGKSTILKQMRILHMNGFDATEMRSFNRHLRFNVFQIFHQVALGVQEFIAASEEAEKLLINQFAEGVSWFKGIDDEAENDCLLTFTELKCVDSFMKMHPNYSSLPDNSEYYVPKLGELLVKDYVPTADDILHLRIPTTAVTEINFSFATSTIRLIDVGGQRTYRKKWIHCFDGVSAVLFVASMAAYDQARTTIYDNISSDDHRRMSAKPKVRQKAPSAHNSIAQRQNRLRESAHLFSEMIRCKPLRSASFILFLNKKDLFGKKLPVHPLGKHIAGYSKTIMAYNSKRTMWYEL
ncbi:hypothetical protein PMAYCL1PPCAC_32272, partial [Pristionchus mayeri]